MQTITLSPADALGEFFTAGEFFPAAMFAAPLPAAEAAISRAFCAEILDPVRHLLGAPLLINDGRQQAGWRFERCTAPGAAGDASDHMVLARNPFAIGAVDLLPGTAALAAMDIFLAVWTLVRSGAVPPPRECLLERRRCPHNPTRNADWVHLTPRETIKTDPSIGVLIDDDRARKARAARTLVGGGPHRFWRITLTVSKSGALLASERKPVRPEAVPV
jgi:hypothetical protein